MPLINETNIWRVREIEGNLNSKGANPCTILITHVKRKQDDCLLPVEKSDESRFPQRSLRPPGQESLFMVAGILSWAGKGRLEECAEFWGISAPPTITEGVQHVNKNNHPSITVRSFCFAIDKTALWRWKRACWLSLLMFFVRVPFPCYCFVFAHCNRPSSLRFVYVYCVFSNEGIAEEPNSQEAFFCWPQ